MAEQRAAAVRAALADILVSPGLSGAPELAALLRYLVEARLAGREDRLTPRAIGVEALGQGPEFDPATDPVVTLEVRRLAWLLGHYHAQLAAAPAVEIILPPGGYRPDFVFRDDRPAGAAQAPAAPAPDPSPVLPEAFIPARIVAQRARAASERSTRLGGTGLLLAVGIVGFIGLQGWLGSRLVPSGPSAPRPPLVRVAEFSDETGGGLQASLVRDLAGRIAADLIIKNGVRLESPAGRSASFVLGGTVRRVRDTLEVDAVLKDAATGQVHWNTTYVSTADAMASDTGIAVAAETVATRVSVPWGPLHAAGRHWLTTQAAQPAGPPSAYICQIEYELAREHGPSPERTRALDCLEKLLGQKPENSYVLAAWAGLKSAVLMDTATPGGDPGAALAEIVQRAEQAVALDPDSSFAAEQLGVVRLNFDPGAATGDLQRALELDPGNLGARVELGQALAAKGDWVGAIRATNAAISAVGEPPAWYFRVVALDAIRRGDGAAAMVAARSYLPADGEVGPVLALCAASIAGRSDEYAPLVSAIIANQAFRASGIGPRLSIVIRDGTLRDRIGRALMAAGITEAQWRAPF